MDEPTNNRLAFFLFKVTLQNIASKDTQVTEALKFNYGFKISKDFISYFSTFKIKKIDSNNHEQLTLSCDKVLKVENQILKIIFLPPPPF